VAPAASAEDEDATTKPEKKKKVGVWFPASNFYPRYIADPLRPQNALTIQWLSDTEVPETGAFRFGLRLGGSFGIRRWHPEGKPDKGWQLSFEGGFAGQFDITQSWDNTAWDGFYGLYMSRMITPELGFRFGSQHNSSHIGDEYSERGIRGSMTFRLETGVQFVSEQRYWKNRASHFAAVDFRTYEETDWSSRLTIQAGLWIPVSERGAVHRLAVEYGTGRSVMGQFLWEYETYFAIGWYYDF
jgi:hypothetical protein